MARRSELEYGSGGSRPDESATALMAGYRLPVVPAAVVKEVEDEISSGAFDALWDEAAPAYSSVLAMALDAGVIAPEQIIAARDAKHPARDLFALYKQAMEAMADRQHARVVKWLARYGLQLHPNRQYTVNGETHWPDGGPDGAVGVLSVEHTEGMYYSFLNVPSRLREPFEVLAKRLMRSGARRGDTDEFFEMTMIGEAIDEARAIVDAYGDIERSVEHIKVNRHIRGGVLEEFVGEQIDPDTEPQKEHAIIRDQLNELLAWDKAREDANRLGRIAREQSEDPVTAERDYRNLIARKRREGVTDDEQRWLRWFEAALVALRLSRRKYADPYAVEIPPGEFMDTQPLEYSALLDFCRPWCRDVVDMMEANVYQGQEPTVAFFPCGTRHEAKQSIDAISHCLLLDALLQAAICLDDVNQ